MKFKSPSHNILPNHDELIIDKNQHFHLYRNCDELTEGVVALYATSYPNDYWKYRDSNNLEHLFTADGVELTAEIKTAWVEVFMCGHWKYMDKTGGWHIMDSNNRCISDDVPFIHECTVFSNGDWEYKQHEHAVNVYVKTTND